MRGFRPQIRGDTEARGDRHGAAFEATQPEPKLDFQAAGRPNMAAAESCSHSSSSPRQPTRSSSALRRLSAVWSRDFTVPRGMPSNSEMASSGRSR